MYDREEKDYRRWDEVWRRVAPELNPYPEIRGGAAPAGETCPVNRGMMPARELEDAISRERAAQRAFLVYAGRTGGSLGRTLMNLSAESGRRACRLRGLYYLLTGEQPELRQPADRPDGTDLRRFLRRQFQLESEAAQRYGGWAGRMEDGCMAEALEQMARESRRRADTILKMLENLLAR